MKTVLRIIFLVSFIVGCESESINFKIAYNVLIDEEADNYEIFVMDIDGKNKKIYQIIKPWIGLIMPLKIKYISSPTETQQQELFFYTKWIQKGKTLEKFRTYS